MKRMFSDRLLRCGTARQRYYLAHVTIQPLSTCGRSGAFLRRWSCAGSHSSRATRKLTISSRYFGQSMSRCSAPNLVWERARPLLSWAVDEDSDKIDTYCSVLGTPNEESWPGVKQLPDYKPTFPQWSAQDLAEQVPYLDAAGIDLLKVRYLVFFSSLVAERIPSQQTLAYDSARRISAKRALVHPYFANYRG